MCVSVVVDAFYGHSLRSDGTLDAAGWIQMLKGIGIRFAVRSRDQKRPNDWLGEWKTESHNNTVRHAKGSSKGFPSWSTLLGAKTSFDCFEIDKNKFSTLNPTRMTWKEKSWQPHFLNAVS